jgi:hypothetical protein
VEVEGSSRDFDGLLGDGLADLPEGAQMFQPSLPQPQEANLLTFAQEAQGKIRLVLRSPADAQIEPAEPASWDTLFQKII